MSEQLTLTIEAKVLGQRKPIVASWSVSVPQRLANTGDGYWRMTLRELLTVVVADEVTTFHQRQQERRLARVMTRAEVEQGAASGKIDMGGQEPQEASLEDAIATALQAFDDRLYLVLLDGAPVETLESELALHAGSWLTFVRLVALVGG
jgi:hypothetical protein